MKINIDVRFVENVNVSSQIPYLSKLVKNWREIHFKL